VLSNSAASLGLTRVTKRIGRAVSLALELIGRHPLPVLMLPSIWFLLFYLPFWKSSDVLCQLGVPFTSENILLVPPIYCVLGRVPFWVTDTLSLGVSPSIFSSQHPSLPAVYALIVCQHAGLWLALRYFLVAVPASEAGRGAITILLASITSFYSFAHTAGAEATTAITWFGLFGVGLRILNGWATGKTWLLYVLVLLLCIGSRHVSGLLLGWMPVTAFLLLVFHWLGRNISSSSLRLARIAGIGLLLSVLVLGIEEIIVSSMCETFGVIQRQMVGRTLSERVGSFLDSLSPADQEQVERRASRYDDEPNLKLAIDSMIRLGTYYQGTNEVIAQAFTKRGLQGDQLQAEVDKTTLKAALRFYRTFDPRLIRIIVKDIVRGFYPTNDQAIALTGPKATFYSVADIEKDPVAWTSLRSLLFFEPAVAQGTLERALHDNLIRHWRFMPIAVWCLLFAIIGTWRMVRGNLPVDLAIIAASIFGIGLAVYVATCICNLYQPRYVLPLWVGAVGSGCILIAGSRHCFPELKPTPADSPFKDPDGRRKMLARRSRCSPSSQKISRLPTLTVFW
jgi:hypothetical protein